MIYVQIKAGLGNQMFEYAFGRAISFEQNRPLTLDTSWYSNHAKRDTPRLFLLDKYNINAKIAVPEELLKFYTPIRKLFRKIHRRFIYKKDNVFNPNELKSSRDFFEGHWSNEKYFKKYADIIRSDLSLKNPLTSPSNAVFHEIKSAEQNNQVAISVHVRRGDCVTNTHAASYQGTVDTGYYDKSAEYFEKKFGQDRLNFFVFSDDIDWAKKNVLTKFKTIYVSNPKIPDYEELHLMSSCNHHVIANSTFSWWAAWLNPDKNKVVIAPKQWLKDTSFNTSDVCPAEWIRL